MACGCAPNPHLQTNAVMCGACPRLDRSDLTTCTIDGQPACSRPCPRGKHVGTDGSLRWLWIRWYGVPMPLRWWGAAGLYYEALGVGAKVNWKALPGCGCVAKLKELWLAVRRWAS